MLETCFKFIADYTTASIPGQYRLAKMSYRITKSLATLIVFLGLILQAKDCVAVLSTERLRLRQLTTSPNEGMLQVNNGKFWGDVCYHGWTEENSEVACRHLGYLTTGGAYAMVPTSNMGSHSFSRGIYLKDVHCNGSERSLFDCENAVVGRYYSRCDSRHVVRLVCTNDLVEDVTEEASTTVAAEMVEPTVQFGMITHSSVALDWTEWFEYAQRNLPEEYVIRFEILYRPAESTGANFTVGGQIPGYFKYGTITNLEERTAYEFKVEAIRLTFHGPGETVGLTSPVVTAITTCSRPPPVENLIVIPEFQNQLRVSWQVPIDEDCPPEDYIVEYQLITLDHCLDNRDGGLDGTERVKTSSVLLTELHPYSRYSVNVSVVNQYGRSIESHRIVETNEGAPSGTPVSISAEYHSSKDTLVTMWADPACGQRNGVITGFTYMLLDVETDQVEDYGTTELTIVHLPDKDPLKKYKFLVAAKTVAGMGPYGAVSVSGRLEIAEICGVPNQEVTTRIVGGDKSRKGAFPWMAQIWNVDKGKKFCAGSILDDHWILTAAHCITKRNVTRKDIRIQLGDHDTQLPEPQQRVYDVAEIHAHVGFNTDVFDDDIALIRTIEPIEFSDYIKPICLPDKRKARSFLRAAKGRYGTVAGWGKGSDGNYTRYLEHVTIPLVDRQTCKKSTNYSFTPNMFCAGYAVRGTGDACTGDSGAPFMIRNNGRYFVTGIVSWGSPDGCDVNNHYGYYTRLFKYMSWIKKIHPKVTIIKHT